MITDSDFFPSEFLDEAKRIIEASCVNQGPYTLWLTGLSASGKSTIAGQLSKSLAEKGFPVYWLDGDVMRKKISTDLGYSAEDRRENLRRATEVAKGFNQLGVTVIASFITPFDSARLKTREELGNAYIEIFVDTPINICEERDPKGLYKRARNGEISEFTGIDSPYEIPSQADIHIKTNECSVDDACEEVLSYIESFVTI